MTNRETMQQALEALDIADNIALVGAAYTPKSIDAGLRKIRDSATALREALAQPEQRPWQGLTPEEVQFCALKHRQLVNAHYDAASDTNIITAAFEATVFYETVEQALKERNNG